MLALERSQAAQLVPPPVRSPRAASTGAWRYKVLMASIFASSWGSGSGCEPIPDQVWLEIPLFSSRAAWRGEIWATMPRLITSSAISWPDQWLIGRSDCSGFSQARAVI